MFATVDESITVLNLASPLMVKHNSTAYPKFLTTMRFKLPITRRSFLSWGALLTGSAVLPAFKGKEGERVPLNGEIVSGAGLVLGDAVFVAESGEYKKDSRFIIGMLSVKNSETHEAAFQAFRTTLNYRSKLTYRSTDRYKKALTDLMINYFVQQADMEFVAKVYDWNNVGAPLSFGKRAKEKIPFYTNLLGELDATPAAVKVKSQSPYGPSVFFKQQFFTETQNALTAVNTHNSNLLQFAGVLTGCVRAATMASTTNSTKVGVLNVLKQILNVPTIQVGTDVSGKFKVIQ